MIDYTERLTVLMRDIVARVPVLSFIDMDDVLVFARFGRSGAAGPVATCHCLSLAPSDPGYYFWRDRATGRVTRRSEWFTSKAPVVMMGARQMNYLISFTLPRFCDQSLGRSRKERFYGQASEGWIAKLDTVVHELYHIDPGHKSIRRLGRDDGTCAANAHTPEFFAHVAEMVSVYLRSGPNPATYEFLTHDFDALASTHGGVVGACFRPYPSYPQRFLERLDPQPDISDPAMSQVRVEPWRSLQRRAHYTAEHLHVRQFFSQTSRQTRLKRQTRAA